MPAYFTQFSALFSALIEKLRGRKTIILGHARPDGDCIGSQVALCRVLRAKGIDALCANPDPVPRRLAFLLDDTPFTRVDEIGADGEALAAIYVDCADPSRAGAAAQTRFPNPLGNIDHHVSNKRYGENVFLDTDAAASAEILAGIFLDLDLPIDPVTANALFTGIATDSGQFRFAATTERCFRIAAELVARGASPARVGNELYEQESFAKLQLLQRFLASLKTECDGRVCIGLLPDGIYEETGASTEDTEGLVDYARGIQGVEIGVLIEIRNGAVKASLRSTRPEFRMDRIAARFGGGGHACAAGLNTQTTSLETFRTQLLAAISEQVASLTPQASPCAHSST